MELKTQRLRIAPMTAQELSALVQRYRDCAPELSAAYGEMLEGCIAHPAEQLWYTCWRITLLQSGEEAGFAGFKGLRGGRAELGYGINEGFEGRGFATEGARSLCDWALSQPGVSALEAETERGNLASQRVLAKLGFLPTGEEGAEGPRYLLQKNG